MNEQATITRSGFATTLNRSEDTITIMASSGQDGRTIIRTLIAACDGVMKATDEVLVKSTAQEISIAVRNQVKDAYILAYCQIALSYSPSKLAELAIDLPPHIKDLAEQAAAEVLITLGFTQPNNKIIITGDCKTLQITPTYPGTTLLSHKPIYESGIILMRKGDEHSFSDATIMGNMVVMSTLTQPTMYFLIPAECCQIENGAGQIKTEHKDYDEWGKQ